MSKTFLPALAVALFASTGCVSQKKFNTVQAELDNARAALGESLGDEAAARSAAEDLAGDNIELRATNAEMRQALHELQARQRIANQRTEQYQKLVERFQSMIDAGTLQVKIVDNRMIVELGTDILFPSGSAKLSESGMTTALQIGAILDDFEGRRFEVEGHTDNVPIKTAQFPSNYELASARAIAVMRMLIDAGVAPEQVSASSFGDTRPVASNDTEDGRARNRRVEIALEPDLSIIPQVRDDAQVSKAD